MNLQRSLPMQFNLKCLSWSRAEKGNIFLWGQVRLERNDSSPGPEASSNYLAQQVAA